VSLPTDGPQEDDPPSVRLAVRAGIAIIGRILDQGDVGGDDLRRLAAYRRALLRLRDHLDRTDP
jgi:hypothetical protein